MDKYIGITENRMKHMLGVARKSYEIAKEKYHLSEFDARKAFVIGFNHDIGYEFSKSPSNHPFIGYEMIENAFNSECLPIKNHGSNIEQNVFSKILNEADLQVDSKGNFVTVEERLEDIKSRYSEIAPEYTNPLTLAKELDLVEDENIIHR